MILGAIRLQQVGVEKEKELCEHSYIWYAKLIVMVLLGTIQSEKKCNFCSQDEIFPYNNKDT